MKSTLLTIQNKTKGIGLKLTNTNYNISSITETDLHYIFTIGTTTNKILFIIKLHRNISKYAKEMYGYDTIKYDIECEQTNITSTIYIDEINSTKAMVNLFKYIINL
jgi:hypothetical protein